MSLPNVFKTLKRLKTQVLFLNLDAQQQNRLNELITEVEAICRSGNAVPAVIASESVNPLRITRKFRLIS
jgi:hypothetical protein